jgi:peptide deformylase
MNNKHDCKLVFYPNDALKQKAELKSEINDDLFTILDVMKAEMEYHNGMGISATQVNATKNAFLMREIRSKDIIEFINPVITDQSGLQYLSEGCLSLPSVFLQVPRAQEVGLTAQNRSGEDKTYVAVDLEAVCIQHEMNHLAGEFYLDKVSRQARKAALKGKT